MCFRGLILKMYHPIKNHLCHKRAIKNSNSKYSKKHKWSIILHHKCTIEKNCIYFSSENRKYPLNIFSMGFPWLRMPSVYVSCHLKCIKKYTEHQEKKRGKKILYFFSSQTHYLKQCCLSCFWRGYKVSKI